MPAAISLCIPFRIADGIIDSPSMVLAKRIHSPFQRIRIGLAEPGGAGIVIIGIGSPYA
ncbi:MAG: hypothetical protein V1714_01305 [Pseudomonadota bacterium]